jgi:hypothetical protein
MKNEKSLKNQNHREAYGNLLIYFPEFYVKDQKPIESFFNTANNFSNGIKISDTVLHNLLQNCIIVLQDLRRKK